MYPKFAMFGAALFVVAMASAPAWSQSREETVEFMFRRSRIETPDMKIYLAKDVAIKEQSCVVEITGKLDGSRYPKFSVGSAPNALVALGGHEYKIKIDFNKVLSMYLEIGPGKYGLNVKLPGEEGVVEAEIPKVVNQKTIESLGARYRGDPAPEVRDAVAESSNVLLMTYLDDSVDEIRRARIPNAFKYFIATFCPGKKTAF
jgi:hypothetical protein